MLALVFAVVDLVAVFFSPSVSALVDFAAVVFAGFFAPSVAAFALVAFLLLCYLPTRIESEGMVYPIILILCFR